MEKTVIKWHHFLNLILPKNFRLLSLVCNYLLLLIDNWFTYDFYIGGGIHGVSIAYYLATKYGIPPLIIEQTRIASAASGKSGGFLARDWGSGATTDLHIKSYNLHRELANLLSIESYREITTLEVDGSRKGKNIPSWLNRKASSVVMDRGTAQVTSSEFTEKLLEAAKSHGAEVLIDTVVGVNIENSEVRSVRCKNSGEILTDNVVLALGPWAGLASFYYCCSPYYLIMIFCRCCITRLV